MFKRNALNATVLLFAALLVVFSLGCEDDNPVTDDGHGAHLEAFGVRLYDGTTLVAEADGVDVTGAVEVAVDDTTNWFSIQFLNAEGDWYSPADHVHEGEEDVFELEVEVSGNLGAVEVGTHEADREWQVRFSGLAAGDELFRVMTLHEGHEDYVSPELPLTVVAVP